jgi:hypothetical protein
MLHRAAIYLQVVFPIEHATQNGSMGVDKAGRKTNTPAVIASHELF